MDINESLDTGTFLDAVITAEEGWFCLSLASHNAATWADQWFRWPQDRDTILAAAIKYAPDYNVYFSSFLFSAQSRAKHNVLPTRTIQADLDEAILADLPVRPFCVVQTSPGRHQGFWILNELLDLDTFETLSRKLTYAIPQADHSGWPIGRTARMPNTINHKYLDGPRPVYITTFGGDEISPAIFELLPDSERPNQVVDDNWLDAPKAPLIVGPNTLLEELRVAKKLPAKIVQQYAKPADDRSAALWALTTNLFRAGLERDVVYQVAAQSANNKFNRLRYGGERELAKDILRAEAVAQRKFGDPRQEIKELRMQPGHAFLVKAAIGRKVMDVLSAEGDWIHTNDNALWYVRRMVGRPITVGRASEQFSSLLTVRFGLNRSESEASYVRDEAIAHVVSLPAETTVGALSHYNALANTVILHTGAKDVLTISKDSIARLPNGAGGILFPWDDEITPFVPDFSPLPGGQRWHDVLFGDAFDYVQDMKSEEANALMRVWTLFILMRTGVVTHPILAYVGAPGSGKSTIMRRLFRLYYGARKELTKATSEEKCDILSTATPFMVLDNLDEWSKWIMDWLATSITNISIPRRKLWTDGDLYHMRRQAVVGVTAHNPKFGREDIADRMLLLTFKRLPIQREETPIQANILLHRNRLWGDIVRDMQRVLAEPAAHPDDVPIFRIADFAGLGLRIARALGVGAEFTAAIKAVAREQKLFSLEEDVILVSSIRSLIAEDTKRARVGHPRSTGVLWGDLVLLSGDQDAFRRLYGNASRLSRKLEAMVHPLSTAFTIATTLDAQTGVKMWSIQYLNGAAGLSADQLQKLAAIEREPT